MSVFWFEMPLKHPVMAPGRQMGHMDLEGAWKLLAYDQAHGCEWRYPGRVCGLRGEAFLRTEP